MSQRRFRYQREDFFDLPVKLNHLTIYLKFFEDRVEALNCLEMTSRTELSSIELDARELTIHHVRMVDGPDCKEGEQLHYDYREDDNKLVVTLPRTLGEDESFCLETFSTCIPSDHILEGIYKDVGPENAPQQYMSQCQQWGFQRIMPILDDCRAKCTMTTTLEGDARYTHLITNGNIDPQTNPQSKPTPLPDNPGRQVITFHNPIPMAPYLFLAVAGTWDELVDQVTYPSGRTVRLEYLVPVGKVEQVRIPMEILKESVLWVEKTQGYEYTNDVYRTICMTKSNFGGMENMGNTTIVTDAALIDEHTLDGFVQYAHAVIVHEFEHNQCGSETTMETPFDVWLNEAYTVDVERRFMASQFDPTYMRLNEVDSIRDPLLGPLAMEDSGHVGLIVRQGFNDPDELIDGVTYVKAAEVINMLRLILGSEDFNKGKNLYFSRFKNANANTEDFFQCFEEVSGRSLEQFKKNWLHVIGYPRVRVSEKYDPEKKTFNIDFLQETPEGVDAFCLPVKMALVDQQGRDMAGTSRVFELNKKEDRLTFQNISEKPAFASLNRDYSFYGAMETAFSSPEALIKRVRLDSNDFNRVEAMRALTDLERCKLIQDPDAEVDSRWLKVYGELLKDETLAPSLKAYFLRIEEQPLNRGFRTWYPEQVKARDRLLECVNITHRHDLLATFKGLNTYCLGDAPKAGMEERMLKSVLLNLIARLDNKETHELILERLGTATTATDRVSALSALNRTSCPKRREVLEKVYQNWKDNLSGYANYLRVISSGWQPDVYEMIDQERKRSTFDVKQPAWCRALYTPMAFNTRMLWTDRGLNWLTCQIIDLAPINPVTTSRLLNAFQQVCDLRPPWKEITCRCLENIVESVPEKASPTIHGQARMYLDAAKKA